MTIQLEVTPVAGGFIIAIPEHKLEAVASTPRQANKRAGEMIEKVLVAQQAKKS